MATKEAKAKKEPKFNDYIGVPINTDTKDAIKRLADAEERDMTSMARVLLKEAIVARDSMER